ncbi:uncharacterized protein [Gossypium hirsutum]|uniref:UTP--glucose-1-phosphate uridylyltransferase n=1 Tax=Gossypium hirsutum TaxID=3635 RepID=A0ABM2Z593_GOSHI|nr:uncharacterized protein LOC107891001 isoform X5 [Gossypium hirsutum]
MTIHSVVIQKLLTTNAHIGRQVATHHFKQFTYGFRNRQSIIDSDKTLICLRNALNFLSCLSRDPSSSFLFINTNPLFQPIIDEMTSRVTSLIPERASSLWKMRGFLTNSCSPKKFRSRHKKLVFAPTKMPDCVVIFDTERKSSVFLEAERLGIPIVALVDSSMPWEYYKKVTYPIPANDSVQFVYLICNMITKCLMLEKKKDGAKGPGKKATIKDRVESTSESEGSASDEVLVVPYENLAPMSCADVAESKQLLDKLVVVKYNGALGKNMSFGGPKSLIEVKNGSTPLDLIVNQIQSLNSKYGCNIPLLLMNPKNTHNDIVKALEKYSTLDVDIHPFEQGEHTQHESFVSEGCEDKWQSSKHGAHFLSLMNSGTLDVLLAQALNSKKMIGKASLYNGLYILPTSPKIEISKSFTALGKVDTVMLWHFRLGHPSFQYLAKLFPALFINKRPNSFSCKVCSLAKHTKSSYFPSTYKPSYPFALIHSDIWGPSRVKNADNCKWFITFIDDHSRITWTYLLKDKSETASVFVQFYNMVLTQFGSKIQLFKSDNGSEFFARSLGDFF